MSESTEEVAALPQEQPVEPASTPEEPAQAAGEPEEPKETPSEPPKEPKGVQKRLDELTRRANDAQRLSDRLIALLEKQAVGGHLPAVEAPSGPPSRDQYATDLEYLEARADYKAAETVKSIQAQAERAKVEQSVAQREAAWVQRQQVAATKYEDYTEVVSDPSLKISEVMAEAIKDSDVGHELAYHLGKNPSEAARIAALSPVSQVRELGKIEARLTTVATKPVSRASAPIDPIAGGKSGTGDPAKMTMDEYVAWRKKQ